MDAGPVDDTVMDSPHYYYAEYHGDEVLRCNDYTPEWIIGTDIDCPQFCEDCMPVATARALKTRENRTPINGEWIPRERLSEKWQEYSRPIGRPVKIRFAVPDEGDVHANIFQFSVRPADYARNPLPEPSRQPMGSQGYERTVSFGFQTGEPKEEEVFPAKFLEMTRDGEGCRVSFRGQTYLIKLGQR